MHALLFSCTCTSFPGTVFHAGVEASLYFYDCKKFIHVMSSINYAFMLTSQKSHCDGSTMQKIIYSELTKVEELPS